MVIPLNLEHHEYEPTLIVEYLFEFEKYTAHLVEHLSGDAIQITKQKNK